MSHVLDGSPEFNFKFYDFGIHHLARCQNTGIVIDSDSPKGLVIVQDGGCAILKDDPRQREWIYKSGRSEWGFRNRADDIVAVVHSKDDLIVFSVC
jgi:hypothetical protein